MRTGRIAIAAAAIAVGLAGCSSSSPAPTESASPAESAAPAAPADPAASLTVEPGTKRVEAVVGQSLDFRTPGRWQSASSEEAVVRMIPATEDVFTPDTPGAVAVAPGRARVVLTPTDGGTPWRVRVRVTAVQPATS